MTHTHKHTHLIQTNKPKKDLATTPLYCEPKDFSSTSSTISNGVTDPEYAVPDVALGHHHLHNHNHHSSSGQAALRLGNGNNNNNNSTLNTGNGSGGHLNSNLNIFGAGFTRIFMGGQTLGKNAGNASNNNKTTAPIPVSAATLHASAGGHSFAHLNGGGGGAGSGNTTSNVAYSGKAGGALFPAYLNENGSAIKSGSSYSVNLNNSNNNNNGKVNSGYVNPMPTLSGGSGAGRQYYASTDLMMVRSPKASAKSHQEQQQMTSNTIYK